MINFPYRHSVCFSFIICLLLYLAAGIFLNEKYLSPTESSFLIVSTIIFLFANSSQKKIILLPILSGFFFIYLLADLPPLMLLITELVALVVSQTRCLPLIMRHKIFVILAAVFLCHLYYIQQTDVSIRQHDLTGITLYMQYITLDILNWRDFNPWYMYYFFHQPLHFLIAGYIYRLSLFLYGSAQWALELLQYLSLFYVTTASIFIALILRELGFYGKIFYALLVIAVSSSTLFLFSGYISDDTPVFLLTVMTVYFCICWYKIEQRRFIICAAFCLGCGILTKLSILLLIPAITFIFLEKIIRERFNRRKIITDLSIFAIISIPLGLSWIIRNHCLFDMQFYNVPDTSPIGQNFKYQTLSERLTDFSLFLSPFINAPTSVDRNIFLALIKTELFGEWDFSIERSLLNIPAFTLYFMTILFKLCSLFGVIYLICFCLKNPKSRSIPFISFFLIQYLTVWGYIFKYAIDYPYVCSTDYRLFAQILIPEIFIIGTMAKFIGSKRGAIQKKKANALSAFSFLYMFFVVVIYVSIL